MNKYIEAFKGCNKLSLMKEPENCKSNYWLNTLRFCDEDLSKVQEQK